MSAPPSKKQPLLTLRAAVVALGALIVGTIAGGLTYFGTRDAAGALLATGGTFAASVLWLDRIVAQ